ncbi:hypothetical protein GGX14DRAFT_377927, partial [Mycena pura]
GDGVIRTGYPGILIESMDFQEIAAWFAMRSSQANFPCPKCLVPKEHLAHLTRQFLQRTTATMQAALRKARGKLTKKDKEKALRDFGLHDVEQILWDFARSDPYQAVSYDTLHWDEGGKFGRHIWVLIKQLLTIGMHCTTERRLKLMEKFVRNYESACGVRSILSLSVLIFRAQDIHDKDFNFLKQHYTGHASSDIRAKGTTNHMSTRIGEGFQQDVDRHYQKTNHRDAEHQMVLIDANEEAMARLDLVVADHEECLRQIQNDAEDGADDIVAPAGTSDAHWRFLAPEPVRSLARFEADMQCTDRADFFDGFDLALRKFLAGEDPEQEISFEQVIQVQSFRGLHLDFQSKMDWSPQRDIVRCSPIFHGQPRYDCVLFNAESDPLSLARLVTLLRVKVPNGRAFDLAFVRPFKNTTWKPYISWNGMRVVEECSKPAFLPLQHVERAALLARAYGTQRDNLYFPLDTVDEDMFLRLNNIE